MKKKLLKSINEAIGIVIIACCIGIVVNTFHPKKVKITGKRPSLKFAPDTVLAQDLPGVSVTINEPKAKRPDSSSAEPLYITTDQVLQLTDNNQALMLDARPEAEFLTAHIPGAQNLPYKNLAEYQTKLDSLPRDTWLICYCDGPPCDQAELLAQELMMAGFELIAVYYDGLNGWKKSGNVIQGQESEKHEN